MTTTMHTSGDPLTGPSRFTLLLATVLAGLSAGFFFAYEASVTLGLAQLSDVAYVETFQAINETIRNPAFGIVFFGSLPMIGLAIATQWTRATAGPRLLLVLALLLYMGGVVITMGGNVPLNDDLARVETVDPASAALARAEFEDDWNQLNLLRAFAFGASFVTLATVGLLQSGRPEQSDAGESHVRSPTGQTG